MKAAVLKGQGQIPVYSDFADPIALEGQQLVHVSAASIKNIDKMFAKGDHYAQFYKTFPVVVGIDGTGRLDDGQRIYMGARPLKAASGQTAVIHGMMAERTICAAGQYIPIPDGLDDITAAAIPNPAVSAWLSLHWRGQIKKGDTVLILGATGVTGRLAIQLAREAGAGKIIALGRNPDSLQKCQALGADILVALGRPAEAIKADLSEILKESPVNIVLDYCWGQPAEILLEMLTNHDMMAEGHTIRYVQIGEMAGADIRLSAAALRSSGLEMVGVGGGGIPADLLKRIFTEIIPDIFQMAASNKIGIDAEAVRLSEVGKAWSLPDSGGKRLVIVP